METEVLENYEQWDLALSSLPPRSHLYRLELIGVGTGMVESLSSYVTRLAEAHNVSPIQLLTHKIASQLRKVSRYELPFGLPEHSVFASLILQQEISRQINATDWIAATKAVAKKVEILEQLTCQKDLCQVTLMPLGDRILFSNIFHLNHHWCSECYRSWRDSNQPIYEPLLWSFNVVVICPYHQKRLRMACPTCKRTQPFFNLNSQPGHCNFCSAWLGDASDIWLGSDRKRDLEKWTAEGIARILAAMPRLKNQTRPRSRVLSFYLFLEQCYARQVDLLEELMNVTGQTVVNQTRRN